MTDTIRLDPVHRNGHNEGPNLLVADDGSHSILPTTLNGEVPLGLSYSSFYGMDSISDAWFGQQLGNLDWLDLI